MCVVTIRLYLVVVAQYTTSPSYNWSPSGGWILVFVLDRVMIGVQVEKAAGLSWLRATWSLRMWEA